MAVPRWAIAAAGIGLASVFTGVTPANADEPGLIADFDLNGHDFSLLLTPDLAADEAALAADASAFEGLF